IYRNYAVLGTALGMPHEYWPQDRSAFQQYWDRQLSALEVTAAARQIMANLFAAQSAPAWLRTGMPLARFLTAGLLPDQIRVQLDLAWDSVDSRREDRLWRVVRKAYPRLPAGIRHAPARVVVGGLRYA
ncbi:MAG: oxygenase MpaB family protein, partial [Yaniella sp.]|nr:oxygenase MpaB family protein [Yaniella sp.]